MNEIKNFKQTTKSQEVFFDVYEMGKTVNFEMLDIDKAINKGLKWLLIFAPLEGIKFTLTNYSNTSTLRMQHKHNKVVIQSSTLLNN